MFGIGYVEVLAALGLALLLVLLRRTWSTARWTRVDDEHSVAVTAEALEAPFTRLLSDLPGTRLRTGGQATWTLVVSRASWWTILPAVALFPLGVLSCCSGRRPTSWSPSGPLPTGPCSG